MLVREQRPGRPDRDGRRPGSRGSPRPSWPRRTTRRAVAGPGRRAGHAERPEGVHDDSNNDNIMGGFSSQGPTDVDYRVKPDLVAPGVNVLSSIPGSFCDAGTNPDGCWAFFNGTSMASPHLAGTAAVVRAAHPPGGRAGPVGDHQHGPAGRAVQLQVHPHRGDRPAGHRGRARGRRRRGQRRGRAVLGQHLVRGGARPAAAKDAQQDR